MDKPMTCWMVDHPTEGLLAVTFRTSRWLAVHVFEREFKMTWRDAFKKGFRAVKVEIREIK